DTADARAVWDHGDTIDQLEVEVDRQAIDIFALRQPAARDLRFVMSVTKMAPVLERIADHACNIARTAIDLHHEPQLKYHVGLYRMEIGRASCRERVVVGGSECEVTRV